MRKYSKVAKQDIFEITDRKREYFDIDTSSYMKYDFHDLGHDYHAHHGPQPVIHKSFNFLLGWRSSRFFMVGGVGQIP